MKRLLALIMILCVPLAAAAETAVPSVTANGVVESRNVYDLTAPYSGVLLPFDWETGDAVKADDVLFEMDTFKVYAPDDGVVSAIFASPGDLATDVISRYGMLAGIERTHAMNVECSTSGAYNEEDNRLVHMGETVFIEQTSDRDNEGEGRIIAVNGKNYVVELAEGDFEDGDAVKIYRDDKMTSKSCIGSGKIVRTADAAVIGSGRVLSCAVEEGDKVQKGDLLFELAAQDAPPDVNSAQIISGYDGALEVAAVCGQQVYKGMLLGHVHDLSQLCVVAEVDEMDLDLLEEEGTLTVVFDRFPDETFPGTVTDISLIGIPKQNAAYYEVTIAVDTRMQLLPGMNATVWLETE